MSLYSPQRDFEVKYQRKALCPCISRSDFWCQLKQRILSMWNFSALILSLTPWIHGVLGLQNKEKVKGSERIKLICRLDVEKHKEKFPDMEFQPTCIKNPFIWYLLPKFGPKIHVEKNRTSLYPCISRSLSFIQNLEEKKAAYTRKITVIWSS